MRMLISPAELAEKLNAFKNLRKSLPFGQKSVIKIKEGHTSGVYGFTKMPVPLAKGNNFRYPRKEKPLKCYGWGNPGFVKAKCSVCSPEKKYVS